MKKQFLLKYELQDWSDFDNATIHLTIEVVYLGGLFRKIINRPLFVSHNFDMNSLRKKLDNLIKTKTAF